MLAQRGDGISGKTATVSGSGNVALHAIEKLNHLGATVVTASDSGGFIHDPDGIDPDKLAWIADLKDRRRGRIAEYAEAVSARDVPCRAAAVVGAVSARIPVRDAERVERRRCAYAHRERRASGGRRREHAERPGCGA